MAKLAAATTLKADYDDYFGYSTSILGDTVLDFEMTKKHINILAIGASYTGDPRMHEAIAEGFGGSANFLVLNGTLSGRVLNHFEGDSINLERDRSQYVRLSDVLHTRNMDDYQSRAENRAVADMIEKVTEAAGTGGWDVVTVTPHSRWGNRPNVWHEGSVEVADSIRAHLPHAKIYLVQNPAYRNDCMVLYNYGYDNQTFYNTRVFEPAEPGEFYTETKHYKDIRASFNTAAELMGIDGIIPNATAFQNARFDEEWGYQPPDGGPAYPDPNYDYENATSADGEPRQIKKLISGFRWNADGKWAVDNHPSGAGKVLVGLDLAQVVFKQDIRNTTFSGWGGIQSDETAILKRIAYETCVEGLMPDTTSFLEYP